MNGEGDHDVSHEENETDSNIGAISVDDDQVGGSIRRNYRHNAEQIQELEIFYKDFPYPNENQRLELGQRLNLMTSQIKFWFQNKRRQARAHQERHNNIILREVNERLQREEELLKQAMILCPCNICGTPTTEFTEMDFKAPQLIAQNNRLVQEIDQLNTCMFLNIRIPLEVPPSSSLRITNAGRIAPPGGGTSMVMNNRSLFLDIAVVATNELMILGDMNCPFWRIDSNSNRESLHYASAFNSGRGSVVEATRETGLVLSTSLALVDTLMNTKKWVKLFAPIVSMASSKNVSPTGFGGAKIVSLQLIQAEFQVISPLIPKRQAKFLRFCKEHSEGFWTVVDFTPSQQCPDFLSNGGLNRLPSGLIIQDMANGYCKVTWIEQPEYDESQFHNHYQLLVGSGIGLSANRWLTTLQRDCQSVSTLSSTNLALLYPGLSAKGATEMVKLAQRMTLNYYSCITGSSVYNWDIIQGVTENMRLMTRKVNEDELGELTGTVLSASTSVWLPVNQNVLFYFLSHKSFRHQWDFLTYNTSMEYIHHIEKTMSYTNYVSLLKIIGNGMQILQEVWNDASGSLIVYAPVEDSSMEKVMKGENSDFEKFLPSGFSILPDGGRNEPGGGCLLTFGFQLLVGLNPTMEITQNSVRIIEELMVRTIDKIKLALI